MALIGAGEKLGNDFVSVCDYCLLLKVCWGQLTQGWGVSKRPIDPFGFWCQKVTLNYRNQYETDIWKSADITPATRIFAWKEKQFLLMSSERYYPGTQPESLSLFHVTDFVFTMTVAPERNYKTPTCQVSPAWWTPLNQVRLRRKDQENSLWKIETGITTINYCYPNHY